MPMSLAKPCKKPSKPSAGIRAGEDYIDLKPQASQVRKRQHQLARQARMQSASVGNEPRRYVTIYRGA